MQRFLREVLDRWLGGDPQLGVLVDGLIEIGNRRLAERVEVDYQGRFSTCKMLVSPPNRKTTEPQFFFWAEPIVIPKLVTAVTNFSFVNYYG